MFKLPVCPYCKTVYHYGEVRRAAMNKEKECYHCNKTFVVSRKQTGILLLILVAVCTAADVVLFQFYSNTTIVTAYIVNIVIVVAAFFTVPFFIRFRTNKR